MLANQHTYALRRPLIQFRLAHMFVAVFIAALLTAGWQFLIRDLINSDGRSLNNAYTLTYFFPGRENRNDDTLLSFVHPRNNSGIPDQEPIQNRDSTVTPVTYDEDVALDLEGAPIPWEAMTRLGSSRMVHYRVGEVLFLAEREQLISFSESDIRIWNPYTGELDSHFEARFCRLKAVNIHDEQTLVLLVSFPSIDDQPQRSAIATLGLEDATFRVVHSWPRNPTFFFDKLLLTDDGRRALLLHGRGIARTIDLVEGSSIEYDLKMSISDVLLAPRTDHAYLIGDGSIWRWSWQERRPQLERIADVNQTARLAFLAGRLYAIEIDGRGRVAATGVEMIDTIKRFDPPHNTVFDQFVTTLPNSMKLITSVRENNDATGNARSYVAVDITTGDIERFDFSNRETICFLSVDPTERYAVAKTGFTHRLMLNSRLEELNLYGDASLREKDIIDLQFGKSDEVVYALTHDSLFSFDSMTGRELSRDYVQPRSHQFDVSLDSDSIAISSRDGTLTIWDSQRRIVERQIAAHHAGFASPVTRFVDNENELLSFSSEDGQIVWWNPSNGSIGRRVPWQPIQEASVVGEFIDEEHRDYRVSSDGRMICGFANHHIEVADTKTGELLGRFRGQWSSALPMATPRPLIAYYHEFTNGDGQRIRRVLVRSLDPTYENQSFDFDSSFIRGHSVKMAINPTQSLLIVSAQSSYEALIVIMNLETGEIIREMKRPNHAYVNMLRFSHSGDYLAALTQDDSVIIWDVDELIRPNE